MHTFTFIVRSKETKRALVQLNVEFSKSSASTTPKQGKKLTFNTMGELACYLDALYTLQNVKQRTFTKSGYITKDYDNFVFYTFTKQLNENVSLSAKTDRGAPIRAEGIDLTVEDKRGDYRGDSMRTPSYYQITCRSFEEFYYAVTALTS